MGTPIAGFRWQKAKKPAAAPVFLSERFTLQEKDYAADSGRPKMKIEKAKKLLADFAQMMGLSPEYILKCIVSSTSGEIGYLTAGDPATPIVKTTDHTLHGHGDYFYIEMKCHGEEGIIDFGRFYPTITKENKWNK